MWIISVAFAFDTIPNNRQYISLVEYALILTELLKCELITVDFDLTFKFLECVYI